MDASSPTNRLARETSPYLLQHAGNPVDWYPWGPEALERARAEEKPIFLSIGYSACHWCHVMEHESFEDERIAALMNEHFVNVKVDREERPDLDEIYMKAVQAMTGQGGWPMSVFLTPDLKPFFGGTYFPPFGGHGRPGFADVLTSLARAWQESREKIVDQGQKLTEHIAQEGRVSTQAELDPGVLDQSLDALKQNYDPLWGGFGDAPKFPHAMDLRLLLRHWKRTGASEPLEMARFTLDRMAEGGIYDQLGGGFHRYSTDREWLIPHFEKMLYDNALLVPAYVEAWLITREERYARVARECCDWVLREMVTPEGAFASTQDADSEGEEGRFFVWTPKELDAVLGGRTGPRAALWYGVTPEGNFEGGSSALWRHDKAERVAEQLKVSVDELEAEMAQARADLFAAREERIKPGTDDKVLASWNGLMISALAQTYQVLSGDAYLAAAQRAARYILTNMRQEDGKLLATARAGRARLNAYLDDYAFLIQGLIDLYESDFDVDWLRSARELADLVTKHFEDEERGAFFTTSDDHEELIARLKGPVDGALPSGNAVHALNLLRLAELCGEGRYAKQAERTLLALGGMVNRYPHAFCQLLAAVDFLAAGPREIVIAGGDEADELVACVRDTFLPQRVVARAHPGRPDDADFLPLLADRTAPAGSGLAYVCRNYACQAPVGTKSELKSALG